MAYQTIIVNSKSKISYNDNYIIINKEDGEERIYIDYISCLIINSLEVTITTYLLYQLSIHKVNVILCDDTHNPSIQVLPIYGIFDASYKLNEQIKWNKEIKSIVWNKIVSDKITNQYYILKKLNITNIDLQKYKNNIERMDKNNVEGCVAKIYFKHLFGNTFIRDNENNINLQLNYGYAVLLSTINHEVVSNGYTTRIGIKHCSKVNWYNLSCDLMEPFRPFVDLIVYKNKSKILDKEVKSKLCEFLYLECKYNEKTYYVKDVIAIYVKDVLNSLLHNKNYIKEIVIE